jgi:hypothetical protein
MLRNVLAFAAVRDIEDGVRWYKMLLGREPDTRPMQRLAEWKFEAGGWLQLNENMQLAGRSSITLVETDMDERMKMLTMAGIKPKSFVNGNFVSIITVTDPDGADSDDLARVYRFDLAQDSEMISPTLPI